jgi:DNA-binding transcriptional LysR family regulator
MGRIGFGDGKEQAVRSDLELRHLRSFVAVIDMGSFTRAAQSLGVSQSTVSEALAALERTLGTPVFRKGGKGPLLTEAGEALVPFARRILALSTEAVTELARVSATVHGALVVSAVESLSAYVLPAHLAALRVRWPNAHLEVISASCVQIRENVLNGKSDLGLVLEASPRKGSAEDDSSVLAEGRLVVFAAPKHPLAGRTVSADDLRPYDFCMSDAAGSYHQALRQTFDAADLPAPRTQTLGTVEGVKRGIVAGAAALGVLPAHAVAEELRSGALREVTVRPALPGLVMRAIFAPGAASSPIVDHLVASLRGEKLQRVRSI